MPVSNTINMNELLKRIYKSDRAAISKAITILEDQLPGYQTIYREIIKKAGRAFKVGIAGPPGAGKSTLISCLTKELRSRGLKVAVIAVDPSSPISGGAILGDRVRMLEHSLDEGVFIRSLASRGSLGGLSKSTRSAVYVFDAAGYDVVLIETVGIGQTELEIARIADITVVVLMPQTGDEVQALKAGLLEIGDIFVMNKSDIEGSDRAITQLAPFIIGRKNKIPILKTVASRCEGINVLADHLIQIREDILKRRDEGLEKTIEILSEEVKQRIEEIKNDILFDRETLVKYAQKILKKKTSLEEASNQIIYRAIRGSS